MGENIEEVLLEEAHKKEKGITYNKPKIKRTIN